MNFVKNQAIKLITSTERIIRTDLKYLIKGYFWFGMDYFIASLAGFATSIAFANLIPPEVYGMYKYTLTIMAFLTLTTLTRLDHSLAISVSKGYEGNIIKIVKTKITYGLLGTFAGLVASAYYFLQNNDTLAMLVLIAAFFTPFLNLPYIYSSYLTGKKNFKVLSILNSVTSIAYAVSIIVALSISQNVIVITSAYLFIIFFTNLMALVFVFKKYKPNKKTEPQTISYGKKISYLGILDTIASQADSLLVFHYLGALELAAYTFIKKMPEQLKDFITFLRPLSTPKFATQDIDDPYVKKEAIRKSFFLSLAMLAIVLVYILLAPFVFDWLFPVYKDYVLLSQIYALSMPIMAFGTLLLYFLESKRKLRSLVKLNIIFSIIKITIIFISLKFYGLYGLVSAFILIRMIYPALITYFFLSKEK